MMIRILITVKSWIARRPILLTRHLITRTMMVELVLTFFPIDGVSDSIEEFVDLIIQLFPIWRKQIRYRYSLAPLSSLFKIFPIKDLAILLAIKLSGHARKEINSINHFLRDQATKIPFGQTAHWSQLVNLD